MVATISTAALAVENPVTHEFDYLKPKDEAALLRRVRCGQHDVGR